MGDGGVTRHSESTSSKATRAARPRPPRRKDDMAILNDYFDISGFPFADIFDGVENAWEALSKIENYILSREVFSIDCEPAPGAWIENRETVSIGEGTVVENGATIIGPALIGKNCTVRQGAYIRGKLVAGDGCVIGHTTEVKNSIFMNGAKAAHFAYVGDSILGAGVNLGAGTKLANFKVDTGDRKVSIEAEGQRIATGLRKLGAILGDGVEIGCNSVTMPGTLVGRGTLVYPCAVLKGIIPAGVLVKVRQEHNYTEKQGR